VAQAAPPTTLAAFRSCAGTLAGLRAATEASVTPYGLPGGPGGGYELAPKDAIAAGAAPSAAGPAAGTAAPAAGTTGGAAGSGAAPPAYSGTNVATPGVDEPDMVKSDGRRIVTTADGILTVVDAATGQVTGRLTLPSAGASGAFAPASLPMMAAPGLLLSGDHALVLEDGYGPPRDGLEGTQTVLYLIDLSGQPTIISTYTIDGSLIDARMIGSVVRAITDVRPNIIFPVPSSTASQGQLLAANRAAIARAPLTSWLPQFESTGGGATIDGQVPCTTISRPAVYSGTSLLSVETFDLSEPTLGTGSAVSIEADGDTVYGTASSLYIASGNQWMASPVLPGGVVAKVARPDRGIRQQTQIYRFALQGSAPPTFAASGSVPGYVVDQYALSEWGGYLRVATTTGLSWALADGRPSVGSSAGSSAAQPSSSAVYVLSAAGPVMREVGKLAGLGLGERIYSVRYEGPVGYVVTFRQTDPLYTVDLSDPAHPRLAGHLSLTGYSSYLQPTSTTQLIGIGQRADAVGHKEGTQVSLFDVTNLAAPSRLSMYSLAGTRSAAENDPHAFLYWPSSQLVVVPITDSGRGALGPVPNGALVLRIDGTQLVPVGEVQQPQVFSSDEPIMRALVIGQNLWTLSPAGLMASDLTTLHQESWLSLT